MAEDQVGNPCPYSDLPETSFWRRSVGAIPLQDIDPVLNPKFRISARDRVATAGSCFAQHIARYLRNSGFNYFVTEPGHPILPEHTLKDFNYGTFSARFGNIYTPRQLVQLFERAYGLRQPVDDVWTDNGAFVDPFRPFIQPHGFHCATEFHADRAQHFGAVREMVEQSDVFVFTLGLTEGWENAVDGTVYAICPGCGAGVHDPAQHRFRNFTVDEATADIKAAIAFMKARNPGLRVLLTVSPVPLIATFENRHVLAATTYSKSVLRVAAQTVSDCDTRVDYFPSFEIITSSASRGAYFADDLREVEEIGVQHAMRCFFRNYIGKQPKLTRIPAERTPVMPTTSERLNDLVCDEQRLEDLL